MDPLGWEFPKIRGTLFSGPFTKDPTISGTIFGHPHLGHLGSLGPLSLQGLTGLVVPNFGKKASTIPSVFRVYVLFSAPLRDCLIRVKRLDGKQILHFRICDALYHIPCTPVYETLIIESWIKVVGLRPARNGLQIRCCLGSYLQCCQSGIGLGV